MVIIHDKEKDKFRNYTQSNRQDTVENHYKKQRENQSLKYVQKMHEKYDFSKEPRCYMTIREAFEKLGRRV